MTELKDVKTRSDLADFLKIPRQKLTYILYIKKVENLYTSFDIPKKTGGVRHIDTPVKDLKDIQIKLLEVLWEVQKDIWQQNGTRPNISHAFEKDKSIITNASIHRNKRLVLNLDLENFFESFHFGRVKGFFEKNRNFQLSNEVATVIAQLVCYKSHLPQGSPSSPIITNLICNILDMRVLKIAKKYKLDYTRYADDLTFSTNNRGFLEKQEDFLKEISKEIERAGFRINDKKTRLQYRDSKQAVTGLVVNKKINVDRIYYKETRAMAHRLYTKGTFEINGELGIINQLEGRFAFINQLEWFNNIYEKKSYDNSKLSSREMDYQKFLYYKYFFGNEKPLIVTEGKTDIVYLKMAFKKFYKEYPAIITKNINGDFEFKISFLNKTKRLRYFFKLQQDGADSMKHIYYFFIGKNKNFPSYLTYFKNNTNSLPKHPVVLIFDNELNNANKPISKFINDTGLSNRKDEIGARLHFNIVDNLYLLTNPIIGLKQECEIEDLFDESTLAHENNGKKFSRNKNIDIKTQYGKAVFAKYVSKEYENINFDNFKPMLDALNEIVLNYKAVK